MNVQNAATASPRRAPTPRATPSLAAPKPRPAARPRRSGSVAAGAGGFAFSCLIGLRCRMGASGLARHIASKSDPRVVHLMFRSLPQRRQKPAPGGLYTPQPGLVQRRRLSGGPAGLICGGGPICLPVAGSYSTAFLARARVAPDLTRTLLGASVRLSESVIRSAAWQPRARPWMSRSETPLVKSPAGLARWGDPWPGRTGPKDHRSDDCHSGPPRRHS